MRVLIVEDHQILSRNLQQFLKLKDIESVIVWDWKEALYTASTEFFDLILLDINLPSMDGDEICKRLREKGKDTPILMLTSRSTKTDLISWLEIWADDYMVKPFDYDELLARVHTLTRRNLKNKSTTQIDIRGLNINLEKKIVTWTEWEIKLSHLEFDLLKYFAQNKWKVLSRQEIYEKVWWEYDEFSMWKTVDVYIWYLRKKLWKELIETKKWFWYVIT